MKIFSKFRSIVEKIKYTINIIGILKNTMDHLYMDTFMRELRECQPKSLLHNGYSVYSQNDEDGLIQSIFKKIGKKPITFIEFGVDPCENNTSLLLVTGSRGVWIDKSLGNFKKEVVSSSKLLIIDEFVSKNNIIDKIKRSLSFLQINIKDLDFLSIDLDGNDYYFLYEIIKFGLLPIVVCVEYNAKFPLPLEVIVEYDEHNSWKGDDYFSASLQSYIYLLESDYTLLCCNSNGINAFFIRNDYTEYFEIDEPEALFMKPKYFMSSYYKGHKSSSKYVVNLLKS